MSTNGKTEQYAPLILLTDKIIMAGVRNKASEIRILTNGTVECNPGTGVIKKLKSVPPRLVPAVRTRLKIQGNLSISEHHRAQVGERMEIKVCSKDISITARIVSTIEAPGEVVAIHY